jgi:predicted DNA binding CopG/RHH family protein
MEVRRRRQARANAVLPQRLGHVPQGPAAEHPLSSKDLEAIQKRALAEGLPYQTLIASLLHKYATGRLKEI